MELTRYSAAAYLARPQRRLAETERPDHIGLSLAAALRCEIWLRQEGFKPRFACADTDRGHPIIVIQVCPRCEWLKTACSGYRVRFEPDHVTGKRTTVWGADMYGCQILWSEGGN